MGNPRNLDLKRGRACNRALGTRTDLGVGGGEGCPSNLGLRDGAELAMRDWGPGPFGGNPSNLGLERGEELAMGDWGPGLQDFSLGGGDP